MSNHFNIGELVIMQHASFYEEYNGYLGVVEKGLTLDVSFNATTMKYELAYCYVVKIIKGKDSLSKEGLQISAKPHQLRRLNDSTDAQLNNEKENKQRQLSDELSH